MRETSVLETSDSAVHKFVEQVRAALVDLPAEDVDDLTGGLEADLAERASELPTGTDLSLAFGTPEAYAAELRSAAGLPARVAQEASSKVSVIQQFEATARVRGEALLTAYPMLRELRPLWWLVRGFVLAYVPGAAYLGTGRKVAIVMAVLGAIASYLLARQGQPRAGSWLNRLVIALGAAALVFLPVTVSSLVQARTFYVDSGSGGNAPMLPTQSGVIVNGEMATNLYAYDAQGKRLEGVRLFNQYGQAVTVSPDAEAWIYALSPDQQPAQGADGGFVLQRGVFPLHWGSRTGWEPSTGGWEPPVQISALVPETGKEVASPSASPTPTTSPSTGASAKPSPSPSATP